MIELAVEAGAGIDLHLHDADHLGTFTMKRLAELTMEVGLQGKVFISHAFGLGDVSLNQAEELAEILADAGVGIISSVPNNRKFPPLELLKKIKELRQQSAVTISLMSGLLLEMEIF